MSIADETSLYEFALHRLTPQDEAGRRVCYFQGMNRMALATPTSG